MKKPVKILIVSDSHGDHEAIRRAIRQEAPIDLLIHAGDIEGDLERILGDKRDYEIRAVAGNMDWLDSLEDELCFPLGEYHRVFLTHGHRFGVHGGTGRLRGRAKELGADIAIFGHIHTPVHEVEDGVTVLNPGSISRPRQEGRKKTYMVMTVRENGRMDVRLKNLPRLSFF